MAIASSVLIGAGVAAAATAVGGAVAAGQQHFVAAHTPSFLLDIY